MKRTLLFTALMVLACGEGGRAQVLSNIRTVFVIMMENTDWSSILGSPDAPYINTKLLPKASHAEAYFTPPGNHPSLPNYLWLEAGTNFGIADDEAPSVNHQSTTAHLVTLLKNAGIPWKSYQEDIDGTVCPLLDYQQYAPRHNPMVYFDDVTGTNNPSSPYCIAHVRPYAELAGDLQRGTVAAYNFITPNVCNDMHDCGINAGDTWLSNQVPLILNSQAYQNGGALFIIWDEGGSAYDGPIGMIVLSPYAKGNGYSNTIPYTHSSTLRTLQTIFNVRPFLGDAANSNDLSDLFGSDFTLSATPSSQTVTAGSSTTYTVTVNPSGGFSGTVTFSVSGLPAGAGGTFNPPSVTGSGSSTLTITTSVSTPANTYPLTIAGSSGSLVRNVPVSLTVTGPADFAVSATPSSQTVTAGSSTTYTATVMPAGGFSGTVTFSVSGLPAGAGGTFNPPAVTGSGSSTLTITTSTSTPANTYPLTITGTSGSLVRSAPVSLTVTGMSDFAVSATPSSRTVTPGSGTSYTATVTPTGGFSGRVTFSVSGLPAGAGGSFNPASVMGSGSSTLTITTSTSTPANTYPLTIAGTSGSLVRSAPVSLTVASGGSPQFAYVVNWNSSDVWAYSINTSTGALTPVAGSPFACDIGPIDVTAHPTGRFVYTANLGAGSVTGFAVDGATGALTSVPGSPFPAEEPWQVAVDPTGHYVYAANGYFMTVLGFSIDPSGSLTPVPGSPFPVPGPGDAIRSVQIHPSGRFLYALDSYSVPNPSIWEFTIDSNSGSLAQAFSTPFLLDGIDSHSMTVDPLGRFAYTDNSASGDVSAVRIDAATGALTLVAGSPFPSGDYARWVAIEPTGRFAYVANGQTNNVSAYSIDSTTGMLTPLTGSPFPAGQHPVSVTVDQTGRFVYVANELSNDVSAYSIDGTTGALAPVPGSPFPAGNSPESVITLTRQ